VHVDVLYDLLFSTLLCFVATLRLKNIYIYIYILTSEKCMYFMGLIDSELGR
jgi:hypothetical protein